MRPTGTEQYGLRLNLNLSTILFFSKEGIKLEIHRYYFRSYQDTFQGSRVGKNKDAQQSCENVCVEPFSFFSVVKYIKAVTTKADICLLFFVMKIKKGEFVFALHDEPI
jgi:hypothetical protein